MGKVTIDETCEALNRFHVTWCPDISQTVKTGMELEQCLRPVVAKHTYAAASAEVNDIVQAFQCDFTPNNEIAFTAVKNELCRMKVDICFECEDLQQFWETWMCDWVEEGRPVDQWAFPRYVYNNFIMPKILENLDYISWNGCRVEPTVGTPGVMVESCDGLKKKIAEAIAAGLVTPIPTGPLECETIVEQVEGFADAIPYPYCNMPGKILMSKSNARKYWRDYRSQFGTGNGVLGNENKNLGVDCTNKRIVPVGTMEGSDCMIFIPDNLTTGIWGRRFDNQGRPEAYIPPITWERECRRLKGYTDFSRFWGFKYWGHVFVNDQCV